MTNTEILPYLTQAQIVAGTLWAEGRSEPVEGRIAIGNVIHTRSLRRKQTMRAVCLAPAQFSCWSKVGGEANNAALFALLRKLPSVDDAVFKECLWIAQGIESGALLDRVSGADHYLTTQLFIDAPPSWALAMTVACVIGHHTFLRSSP